jgi:O-antigen ligase
MKIDNIVNYIDKFIIGSLLFMMFSSAISIGGSSIGMGFAFLAWIIKMIIKKIKSEEISFVAVPFSNAIWLLFAAILISFIGTYDFQQSLEGLEDYLIVILLFYTVVNNVKDLETVKKMFGFGVLSIILSSLYGVFYQYLYQGISRIDSTFMALDFGALLLMYSIFVMTYLFFAENSLKFKYLSASALILLLVTLILNKSRGAWLGFAGGSFMTFWLHKKKLIPIFLIALIVIVLLAPAAIQDRIISITDIENNRSNLGRIALWKGALMMFKDNPVNGVGSNNFEKIYLKSYKQPNTTASSHAHNTYLNFLAETGIIGFSALIYLFFSISKYLFLAYQKLEDEFSKLFVLSVFSSFLGTFVIQGMTESNFSKSVVGRTLWFLIALAVIIVQINEQKTELSN